MIDVSWPKESLASGTNLPISLHMDGLREGANVSWPKLSLVPGTDKSTISEFHMDLLDGTIVSRPKNLFPSKTLLNTCKPVSELSFILLKKGTD